MSDVKVLGVGERQVGNRKPNEGRQWSRNDGRQKYDGWKQEAARHVPGRFAFFHLCPATGAYRRAMLALTVTPTYTRVPGPVS